MSLTWAFVFTTPDLSMSTCILVGHLWRTINSYAVIHAVLLLCSITTILHCKSAGYSFADMFAIGPQAEGNVIAAA